MWFCYSVGSVAVFISFILALAIIINRATQLEHLVLIYNVLGLILLGMGFICQDLRSKK